MIKIWLIDTVLIFIASLTPLLWFKNKEILTGHDSGYPLNPLIHFLDRLSLWSNRFGFGRDQTMEIGGFINHGHEALLSWLGLSVQAEQKIIFIGWFLLIGLSMYFLAKNFFGSKKHRYLPLISSFLLMFNSYTLQSWPLVERGKFSVTIATVLTLAVLNSFFKNKLSWFKTVTLVSFILFFFNAYGAIGLPLWGGFVVAIGIMLVFSAYTIWLETDIPLINVIWNKIIPVVFFIPLFLLLLDAYWILPLGDYTKSNLSVRIGAQGYMEGLIAWLRMVSVKSSLLNLFRWQGEAGWYGSETTHPYGFIYLKNLFLLIASFIWPILALSAYFTRQKEDKKNIIFLILLFLVGMFFTAGSYPPTGYLFEMLFKHFPGMFIFRSAWFKFNYIISISYALLIAYTIEKLITFLKIRLPVIPSGVVLVSFLLILGIYNFPYFGRQMFVWNKPLTLMLEIPPYIADFEKWVNNKPETTRLLVLPPINEQWSGIAYSWGYFGGNPPTSLLTNRTMFINSGLDPQREGKILSMLYGDLLNGNQKEAKSIIELLGIEYMVLQNDTLPNLSWIKTVPPEKYIRSLSKITWLSPEKTIGEWSIYRVKSGKQSSPVLVNNDIVITNLPTGEIIKHKNIQDTDVLYVKNDNNAMELSRKYIWEAKCQNCQMEQINFSLPVVKILPGSRFYGVLVERKEKELLKAAGNLNFNQKADLFIGLSLKRLAEIDRLTESDNYIEAEKVMDKLSDYIQNILKTLADGSESDISSFSTQVRVYYFSQFAEERLKKAGKKAISARTELSTLRKLISEIPEWKNNNQFRIYLSDIPKESDYKLSFTDDLPEASEIIINNKPIRRNAIIHLDAGKHKIEVKLNGSDVFDERSSLVLESVTTNPANSIIPEIKIKRINQNKYSMETGQIDNDFWLYFSDSYNGGWKVFVDDQPVIENRHFIANGYANAWLVKKTDFRRLPTHKINLIYFPQSIFRLGAVISVLSFCVLSLALILSFILRKERE